MSKIIKILADKEPLLNKFFKLGKKASLQRAAITMFAVTLITVSFSYDVWQQPNTQNIAYAAQTEEVINYPSETLSMKVMCKGKAPELESFDVVCDGGVDSDISDEPILFIEVMGISGEQFAIEELSVENEISDASDVFFKNSQEIVSDHNELREEIATDVENSIIEQKKAEEELKPKYINNPEMVISLTQEELDLFYRIVQCEAGSEDMIGKILVANVIINRVNYKKFPDSVEGVILSPGQFSPVLSGAIYETVPSEATKEAVNRALKGEDYSDGSLYFIARRYCSDSATTWFDTALTKTIEHGNHEFFK